MTVSGNIKFGNNQKLRRVSASSYYIYVFVQQTKPVKRICCKDIDHMVKLTTKVQLHMKDSKKKYTLGFTSEKQMDNWVDILEEIIEFHQKPKPREMDIQVYFADGSSVPISVEYGKTTAGELWWIICEIFNMNKTARDCFFVFATGNYIDVLLRNDDILTDILENWKDIEDRGIDPLDGPCKIFFKKVIVPLSKERNIKDAKSVYLFYMEAKYHIFKGNYILPNEACIELAGLVAQITHGDYDASKMKPGCYAKNAMKYLPHYIVVSFKKQSQVHCDTLIREEHKKWSGKRPIVSQLLYLQRVRILLPYYGSIFFMGMNRDKKREGGYFADKFSHGLMNIGLNADGIHLFFNSTYKRTFSWRSITHWEIEQDKFFYFTGIKDTTKKKKRYCTYLIETKFAFILKEMIDDVIYDLMYEKKLIERTKLRQSTRNLNTSSAG